MAVFTLLYLLAIDKYIPYSRHITPERAFVPMCMLPYNDEFSVSGQIKFSTKKQSVCTDLKRSDVSSSGDTWRRIYIVRLP